MTNINTLNSKLDLPNSPLPSMNTDKYNQAIQTTPSISIK